MNDPNILTALDACRPRCNNSRSSDPQNNDPQGADLQLPEMADAAAAIQRDPALRAVFDRIQALDGRIVAVCHDLPVPAGLAERLMAAMPRPEVASRSDSLAAASAVPTATPAAAARKQSWHIARWAVAATVLLSLAWAGYWAYSHRTAKTINEEQLASQAADWHLSLANQNDWTLDETLSRAFPASSQVAAPVRLLDSHKLTGRASAAYDLARPGSPPATLFVLKMDVPQLAVAPPSSPRSETANLSVGCWQSKGFVYVLVVQGDARMYRQYLNSSSGGLT